MALPRLALLLLTVWSMNPPAMIARGQPAARVLFIGNSLTAANNLPAMIEAVAAQAGLKGRITCRAVALPNFGLQEHWEQGDRGEALRALRNGPPWTHVVLQQGPTSQLDSRLVLREFARRFAFEAKSRGATVVLYSPWTSRNRLAFMDAVLESHRLAAADVGGMLVPVGEGWRAAWRQDPSLPLYGPDDFHPSPIGSYLAALMFFERLSGRSPAGLPNPAESPDKALREVKVDATRLGILQVAAADANGRSERR
ncbi:MAG: SGNH/GDSL hydrolase family protein [Vicinamibacterales bacterium]